MNLPDFPIGHSGILTTPAGLKFSGFRGSQNFWRVVPEDIGGDWPFLRIDEGDTIEATYAVPVSKFPPVPLPKP